jgi:hypothetical protein
MFYDNKPTIATKPIATVHDFSRGGRPDRLPETTTDLETVPGGIPFRKTLDDPSLCRPLPATEPSTARGLFPGRRCPRGSRRWPVRSCRFLCSRRRGAFLAARTDRRALWLGIGTGWRSQTQTLPRINGVRRPDAIPLREIVVIRARTPCDRVEGVPWPHPVESWRTGRRRECLAAGDRGRLMCCARAEQQGEHQRNTQGAYPATTCRIYRAAAARGDQCGSAFSAIHFSLNRSVVFRIHIEHSKGRELFLESLPSPSG